MNAKAELIDIIRQMPDDLSAAELVNELAFRLHVEEGRMIPHSEARRRHAQWLN